MSQIGAFFLIVFSSLFIYGHIRSQALMEQMDKLNRDMVLMNVHLTKLESQATGATRSKLLENEIAILSNELSKRQQVQDLLSSHALGNTEGLSGYLEAFARQHVQGNWLTKITIANGGKSLGIAGKTLSSELVPVYMDKLAGEALLNGISFNIMELIRPAGPSNQLDFYISTH